MKKGPRLHVLFAIIALIVCAMALAGCGKQEAAAPVASPTTDAPAATDTTTPPASTPGPAVTPADPAATTPGSTTPAVTQPATSSSPAPAAQVKPTPGATTQPAAPAKPTPSQPAATTAPAVTVPASLTGAKADAYKLLIGCKYSGSADSTWNATMIDVPILGDVDMKVTSAGNTMSAQGVPGTVGGDFTNRKLSVIPFNEVISGNASAIEAFLKSASSVTVSGGAIKVNSQPPSSIVTLLNTVAPGKVTWTKKDLTMSCTINVAGSKVTSIKVDSLTGTCNAPLGKIKGKVNGSVTY
ncbi:MAG: hypothetical protein ACM3O9_07875 [Methylocystaceae bacterium]